MALRLDTGRATAIVGSIIGAVVVILVLAAVMPDFFTALADANAVLNDPTTTTNDTTADSLLTIFPLILGIAGIFSIVGIAIAAVSFKRG